MKSDMERYFCIMWRWWRKKMVFPIVQQLVAIHMTLKEWETAEGLPVEVLHAHSHVTSPRTLFFPREHGAGKHEAPHRWAAEGGKNKIQISNKRIRNSHQNSVSQGNHQPDSPIQEQGLVGQESGESMFQGLNCGRG
jgi:hypothetical protein